MLTAVLCCRRRVGDDPGRHPHRHPRTHLQVNRRAQQALYSSALISAHYCYCLASLRGLTEEDFDQVAEFFDRSVTIAVDVKERTGSKLKDFKALLADGGMPHSLIGTMPPLTRCMYCVLLLRK